MSRTKPAGPTTGGAKLIQKRKQTLAKTKRVKQKHDKLAGLSPTARKVYDAREAVKVAAKQKQSEEGRAALRQAQAQYRKQLDAVRKARDEKQQIRRKAAAAQILAKEAQAQPGPQQAPDPPRRKVTFAPDTNVTRAVIKDVQASGCPNVQELRTAARYACNPVPLPSVDGLATMAAASVVYADAVAGIGAWGDGAGTWAAPQRWHPFIDRLNRAYNTVPERDDDGSRARSVLGMTLRNGEYNMVFFPEPGVEPELPLPPLVDGTGRTLAPDEVVFRLTRPDAATQHNGDPFYRYKTLAAMRREFYYTLHGAANDFAPPCLAAVLYPAVVITYSDGTQDTLYGALYVLHKASKDLVSLIDDETKRLRTLHAGRTQSPAYAEALRRSGRKAALWLLPVLARQARLGALSFDAKPANYVFGADGKPYAIDFDAAMYSVSDDTRPQWHAALLMLIGLLTAHVRLFVAPALADGWATALRPLVIELCGHARSARWLFDARVVKREFKEILVETDEASRCRLEMMTHVYFTKARSVSGAPFRPDTRAGAPGLTEQLLKYSLHGTTCMQDDQLAAAMGCAKAHSALAAAGNGGRPWGG